MRLRPEFEALRGSILHRSPLPSITDAISEFIAKETRLRLLSSAVTPTQSATALTTSRHASSRDHPAPKPPARELPHSRQQKSSDFCNYCKKKGHRIPTFPLRESRHGPYIPRFSAGATSATPSP